VSASFNFDLIDAAGYGYHRVWAERQYLIRLAFIPLILKFACAVLAYSLGYTDDLLRRGLIILPAVFAQGWVMAQFLRTLLMEERWPMPLPERGDEAAFARVILRARGIVSSTLVFVLINLASTVLAWGAFELDRVAQGVVDQQAAVPSGDAENPGANMLLFIPAVAAIFLSLWSIRLLWVYIPYAVLMPIGTYLKRLGGFMASIRLAGLYLICMVPLNVLAMMMVQGLLTSSGATLDNVPAYISFISIFLGVITDFIVGLLATAAVAYAMRGIIPHHAEALKDVASKKP
jgi:hypothetical protein